MNIPRKNTETVKEILESNQTNSEKAIKIWTFHNMCLQRESDGVVKNNYTPIGIEKELNSSLIDQGTNLGDVEFSSVKVVNEAI
jgi:hypothetical protein